MPIRRPAALVGLLLVFIVGFLCASTGLGQEVRRSKVYRMSLETVELHLADLASIAPAGSITIRPGSSTAEVRFGLRLADVDVAAEDFRDFRQSGFQKAAAMPAYCPIGWFHLHLGSVPCPREAAAACATICFAHPMCSATLSWIAYTGVCQDTCKCDPED
jgi:hypothetical protein